MQTEQCLIELHIPQYTPLWPQIQAQIIKLHYIIIISNDTYT